MLAEIGRGVRRGWPSPVPLTGFDQATDNRSTPKKIYVLDTNVLLHDPTAVTAFNEHHVVIPMTVLEELDHIKDRRDKTVSREARIAIQMIDRIVDAASPQAIQAGVPIPGAGERLATGTLAIYPDQLISDDSDVPYLDGTPDQANDNRIINVALKLQAENEAAFVCLVTKDINMRIKAKGSGLMHVEDYRTTASSTISTCSARATSTSPAISGRRLTRWIRCARTT
jgi:PhoH-like ATPase